MIAEEKNIRRKCPPLREQDREKEMNKIS